MPDSTLETTCCVVGGGPAGMMLGLLLARSGVRVTVLEKHRDFLRDFRGDTVHPSTLEVLYELGMLDEFLTLPHQRISQAGGVIGGTRIEGADFRRVPAHAKFIALMPQWDFLNFLAGKARGFPSFELRMQCEATGLLYEDGRVSGVAARGLAGENVNIRTNLVIACDGRNSTIRQAARLTIEELGVPIDVLWFRISRKAGDPEELLGLVNYGKALVLINRATYFQAGMIIRKGSFDELKQLGLDAFRNTVVQLAPWIEDRVDELKDWDQIKLLTVQINRLRRWWRPGLLCIGDAAHAMSPAGGVGINLAIQDAVAAANILAHPLRLGNVTDADLAAVQRRREFPARVTQAFQVTLHRGFARVFQNPGPVKGAWLAKLVTGIPGVRRLLGYAVGIGVRPEHVTIQPASPAPTSKPQSPSNRGSTPQAVPAGPSKEGTSPSASGSPS